MRNIKLASFAGIITLFVASLVYAGPLEDAATAYGAGDYKKSFQLTLAEARHGNAQAQYNLGLLYCKGQGTNKNYPQGIKWYQEAGKQGHAGAFFNLGIMHEKGLGVKKDTAEAVKWYRQAAAKGDTGAKRKLKELNADRNSTSQPSAKTTQDTNNDLFGKDFGQDSAFFGDMNLDSMDAPGMFDKSEESTRVAGVESQPKVTVNDKKPGSEDLSVPPSMQKILDKALHGDSTAQVDIGDMYWTIYVDNRKKPGKQKFSQTAMDKAFYWFAKADVSPDMQKTLEKAHYGDVDAQVAMGSIYYNIAVDNNGKSAKKTFSERNTLPGTHTTLVNALYWFTKAGNQGNLDAQYILFFMYIQAKETVETAQLWEQKALAQKREDDVKNPIVQTMLGRRSFEGDCSEKEGAEINECKMYNEKAFKWYKKAAEQEYVPAYLELARYYLNQKDVSPELFQTGVNWLIKAAEKNHAESQFQFGLMLLDATDEKYGIDSEQVKEHTINGTKFIRRAADQGYPEAIEYLKKSDPAEVYSGL